ncbi:uncharacterized protein BJ171DRAFT_565540 [Polychytrium aggregatum]|uniref:uncharacterized protein n=1 Tax=Polychytrium aggregatum TaxID=110093 RepID=UPI0022FE4068|nr:uncharacterized protein BJ171DRAFT_596199 [Polychytrium aggregatum]XP_052969839.1 uncharacterized protein BJ171DRAFT_565540 [Polychytrium aggregatum]KAI9207754.1 hypothetical protein BJ171DRAFT_596199 [Polychytrium aggregatum]KAI9207759.1 hypothetical protein BJ171DRAFT_565540 [Polychytrium aggregatum]
MAASNLVLIPIDSISELSRTVILHALKHSVVATDNVEILHIIKPSLFSAMQCAYEHREIVEVTQRLTKFVQEIVQASGVANKVSLNVIHGEAKGHIMMEISDRAPRLVVMGAHPHGPLAGTGSITGYVSQRSPCPVLVLPHSIAKTAVPMEGSSSSIPIAA